MTDEHLAIYDLTNETPFGLERQGAGNPKMVVKACIVN